MGPKLVTATARRTTNPGQDHAGQAESNPARGAPEKESTPTIVCASIRPIEPRGDVRPIPLQLG